jgi:Holliday junction resolvase
MSRLFSRIDANQPEIVKALRKAGASVQHLSAVGQGCPDLLVAVNQQVFLIEVKDGSKIPSKQKLTPDQVIWHAEWKAEVHVVNSIEGALQVAQLYKTKGK